MSECSGVSWTGAPPVAACVLVDRAVTEFRRGRAVVMTHPTDPPLLVQSGEILTEDSLLRFERLVQRQPSLLITGRRASVLGYDLADSPAVRVRVDSGALTISLIAALGNPMLGRLSRGNGQTAESLSEGDIGAAAVFLAKISRLLPVVVCASLPCGSDPEAWAQARNILTVDAARVTSYLEAAARDLRPAGEARIPLRGVEGARIIAFRTGDGGLEHLAIVIGDPDPETPVLVRLHSECFTGDLVGSLRCDCGDQLRGAMDVIVREGSGLLLYLAQEGRGIGLVNKLRAYNLQDQGFDTMDANGQLGFYDDERLFLPAAEMLRHLGFSRVRLLTNNPDKVDALASHGIHVERRVPHVFATNVHNLLYLRAKAAKGGHLL